MKNAVLHRIYLYGHGGNLLPARLRRTIARSEIHRAWLYGFNGCFSENGIKYGPANPYGRGPQPVYREDRWFD